MMAAQLLGTGGVAILLLLAAATETPPIVDVALLLALFAAFAAVAFVRSASDPESEVPEGSERRMKLAFDIFTVFAVSAGCVLLFGGDGRLDPLPGLADAPARTDQGGQSWPWPCRSGPVATGERSVRRVEAGEHLAAGPVVRRDRYTAHCRRGSTTRTTGMTILSVFDIGLVVLILGIGAWTIAAREAFAAVIGFVVYGLLLSIAWVRLSAVDVALTEAAIGGGMTGMLMLGAVARLRSAKGNDIRTSLPVRLAAGALCTLVAAGLAIAVLSPPEVIPTLAPMAMENLPQTGLGNPVAGVLFVLPRARHAARESGPDTRFARRLVVGAGWRVGRNTGAACLCATKQHADISCPASAAGGNRGGNLYVLGRSERTGRRLSRRHGPGRDVAPCHDRRPDSVYLRSASAGYACCSSSDR